MALSFYGVVILNLVFLVIFAVIPSSISQQASSSIPTADTCNGIFLTYTYETGQQLPPNLTSDPANQAYRFQSFFIIQNNWLNDLKSWRVFVGFQHGEYLVSATSAVLADGNSIPGNVGNGTIFAGYPTTDLKTAIETAGDLTQMRVQVDLVGTQFGVAPPGIPLPSNITLANDGYICPQATMQGNRTLVVCCTPDPAVKTNVSASEEFLPRQSGDLTIMYDVTKAYDSSYFAQVTIANHNPLGRLDYWHLSWDWMRDEFIYKMQGAYPSVVDYSECIFGPQGTYYQALDFSTVLNCERRPTIIDLPLSRTNDTNLGMIPYCCRNGTILPPQMDFSKSISAFQMQVFKMPPDLNRSDLTPPQNWAINGTLNPTYKCGAPVRVSASQFPDPSGLPSETSAIASWQIVCNITQPKNASPKCCVSFSAYYNESVVPCRTCACGCPSSTSRSCSTTTPAMLLPSDALLVPFDNRSAMAVAWASLKHLSVPNPMPCGDNCGVSINWHLYTDYTGGWSARITLFNWDNFDFSDWFAAVEMDKAASGFQKMYSFNGTSLVIDGVNNTIFMQGLPGLNYLVGEVDGATPQDPRVPGKQQSVISFSKKYTPGINVAAGDGFPTKVFFNGEECSLPTIIPTSGSRRVSATLLQVLLVVLAHMLIRQ